MVKKRTTFKKIVFYQGPRCYPHRTGAKDFSAPQGSIKAISNDINACYEHQLLQFPTINKGFSYLSVTLELNDPFGDRCMHPLLKIDRCKCTRCTRTDEGPVYKIVEKRKSSIYQTENYKTKWKM